MHFINPKTDFAFKRIFGGEHSKEILISFLNAILYQEQAIIEDLEILNPYLAPKIRGVKDTYLDVKAKTVVGEVIIEMQVLNVEGFEKRILYNAAKTYSTQLATGEDYTLLNPVIALTLTDFILFEELSPLISRFILKEKDYLVDYPIHDIELVFVELPKFEMPLEALKHLWEKWIFFIKHARQLEEIPESFQQEPALKQAFEIANEANLNKEELEDLEKREIFIHDQRNAIKRALKKGRQEGIEQERRAQLISNILLFQKLLKRTVSQEDELEEKSLEQLRELVIKLEQELLV